MTKLSKEEYETARKYEEERLPVGINTKKMTLDERVTYLFDLIRVFEKEIYPTIRDAATEQEREQAIRRRASIWTALDCFDDDLRVVIKSDELRKKWIKKMKEGE